MRILQHTKQTIRESVSFPPGCVVDVPTSIAAQLLNRGGFVAVDDAVPVGDEGSEQEQHRAEIAARAEAEQADTAEPDAPKGKSKAKGKGKADTAEPEADADPTPTTEEQ